MPQRAFGVETVRLDLPAVVGGFGRRLHEAGLPVSAERAARFAEALDVVRPVARRRLYWTARGVFVTDPSQVRAFDAVFREVFGSAPPAPMIDAVDIDEVSAPLDADGTAEPGSATAEESLEAARSAGSLNAVDPSAETPGARAVPVPTLASEEESLWAKRFDALAPDELARIYRLMAELSLAAPQRRTRRAERASHGSRVDVRRTLRSSLRTGGDPIHLARRRRRMRRRPIVLLCDISGSMEPYARAYLQFLTCAAGSGVAGNRNEAFVFATRLTRLTRALHSRHPERAIQQAAAAAPDWSSGTRIGDALKTFNDLHGRRGMARGAVVVILSDGWERGDPGVVGREMERLARLAYRIVWVNPRAAAPGFSPRAGGMAAALPHCDALLSGHSLTALSGVIAAIGAEHRDDTLPATGWRPPSVSEPGAEEETWASATPVPGSSVAMPSGYGPSRGRTTPGWGSG